jgi:alkaline phosphatase D
MASSGLDCEFARSFLARSGYELAFGEPTARRKTMNRRNFLRAVLVTAGNVWVASGCDDDDPTNGGDAGGDVTDTSGDGTDTGPELEDGSQFFPQSVASGDPRDTSVILWTRVEDSDRGGDDVELLLQVALDDAFTQLVELDGGASMSITADAFDHCIKVRLANLQAGSVYYYRFIHTRDSQGYVSRTGRTKTAPAPDADATVRFAMVSCQDFNGRYYNTYRHMAAEELDFVLHLGDYIYETTGDPAFQDTAPDRVLQFTDEAGAIVFNESTMTNSSPPVP